MDMHKMPSVDCYYPPENSVHILNHRKCTGECGKKCVYVCPAGLFKEDCGEVRFDEEGICLECGACRLVCQNIVFDYPEAGRGIIHRFG